jgi:hypothetical protein
LKLLRTIQLNLTSIKRPGGWANELDHGVVGGLVQQISAGVPLPPIKVAQNFTLVAGRHRLAAHDRLKRQSIRADVIEYTTVEEAEADAICENLRRRQITGEERDRQLSRLVEIYHSQGIPEPAAEKNDLPPPQRAEASRPTKTTVNRAVAEKAGVSERTVERAVARQAPKAPPPVQSIAQREDAFLAEHGRKRRAKALKRMAELLRKVADHISDLEGVGNGAMARITVAVTEAQTAVWDASVADGRDNSLLKQTGEGGGPDVATPVEPGEAKRATLSPGESERRPAAGSVSASRAQSRKRLRIEVNGEPYAEGRVPDPVPDIEDGDIPF